ncbi:MAG: hypothetical protein IJ965_05975, partial [Campylobacter sp.]|nr:hypothetical protein [Campylobacter sp.]
MIYKIFCDESNHLEYKENKTLSSNVMVLGAICINENESINFSKHLKFLKHKYNYKNEIKWTKLFSSKHDFYDELISSFFNNTALKFRAILVDNKQNLNHKIYNEGDADQFYYKAYFYVLKELLANCEKAKIYLDYKDNKCGEKMKKLSRILTGIQDISGTDMEKIAKALGKKVEFFLNDEFIVPQINTFM